MKKKQVSKKVVAGALAGIALVAGASGALLHSMTTEPTTVVETKVVNATDEQVRAAFADGVSSVDVEAVKAAAFAEGAGSVEVTEVVTEVPVDNGNLEMVLQWVYDNAESNIELITDDLDDDEVGMLVERIVFWNDIKDLAVAAVKEDGEDELDNYQFVVPADGEMPGSIVVFDDKDIDDFDINDDHEDIVVDEIDFDDKEATLFVSTEVEMDDVDYLVVYKVDIEDGEVDDLSVHSVELK